MRFLIDGYNVTMRDPVTGSLPAEDQRDALVARLAVRGEELLGRGAITVVFDGVGGAGPDSRRGRVDVRFSRAGTADDLIAALAAETAPEITVVTSDAGLAERVRASGATVLGAETCFERRTGRRRGGRYPAATVGLPRGANRITEELKRLWLDDEE